MAQSDKLDHWLPMGEVVAQTGLSERTVYRMVAEGRLKQAQRRIPGRRPMSVFDPSGVAAISASTFKPRARPQQPAPQDGNAIVKDGLQREETFDSLLPPSELSFKLYLTEEEAIRYTGFGRAFLRATGKGRMIGPRGSKVYRRVDLEKL
jgi:predicted DNA-binding transcriptional regulator AlpA